MEQVVVGGWGCAGVDAAPRHGRERHGWMLGGSWQRNNRLGRSQGDESGAAKSVEVDRFGATMSGMGSWDTVALDKRLMNNQTCLAIDCTDKVDCRVFM
jgi:hypothetical protein